MVSSAPSARTKHAAVSEVALLSSSRVVGCCSCFSCSGTCSPFARAMILVSDDDNELCFPSLYVLSAELFTHLPGKVPEQHRHSNCLIT